MSYRGDKRALVFAISFCLISIVFLTSSVQAVPTYFKWFNGSGTEATSYDTSTCVDTNTYNFNLSGSFFRSGTWNGSFSFKSNSSADQSGINYYAQSTGNCLNGACQCNYDYSGTFFEQFGYDSCNLGFTPTEIGDTSSTNCLSDSNVKSNWQNTLYHAPGWDVSPCRPSTSYPSFFLGYPFTENGVSGNEEYWRSKYPSYFASGTFNECLNGVLIQTTNYAWSTNNVRHMTVVGSCSSNAMGQSGLDIILGGSYSCNFVEGNYVSCTPGASPPVAGLYCCSDNQGGNYWTPIACASPPPPPTYTCGNGVLEEGEECELGGVCPSSQESCFVGSENSCPATNSDCNKLLQNFASYTVDNSNINDATYNDNIQVSNGKLRMTIIGQNPNKDTAQSGAPEYNWKNKYIFYEDIVYQDRVVIETDYNITTLISGVRQGYLLGIQRGSDSGASGTIVEGGLQKGSDGTWFLRLAQSYGSKLQDEITLPLQDFQTGKLRLTINEGKISIAFKGSDMTNWVSHTKDISFPLTKGNPKYYASYKLTVDQPSGSNGFPGTSEVFWDNLNITTPCVSGSETCMPVSDICDANCKLPVCGNSIVDAGEACDDGMQCSGNTSMSCTSNAQCAAGGFGVCQTNSGDGCRNDCLLIGGTTPTCGNARLDSGEECDDGCTLGPSRITCEQGPDDQDQCSFDCKLTYCGDGYIQAPNGNLQYEECDDGSSISGDGCSSTCLLEEQGDDENPLIVKAQWKDESGQVISQSREGQNVRLYVLTEGLISGTRINLNITEDDSVGPLKSYDHIIVLNVIVSSDGTISHPWTIPSLESASEGATDPPWELFFNASNTTIPVSGMSNELNVELLPFGGVEAVITGPKHRGVYYNNTNINFTQQSINQGLVYEWLIEDNSGNQPDILDNRTNFIINFQTPGQRTITLKVTNDTAYPEVSDEDQISILVVSSPGAFAFITAPEHKEVVNRTVSKSIEIQYNASDSFVIDSNIVAPCSANVLCLAGNCPSTTENSPASCGGNPLPITSKSGNAFDNNLSFSWSFVGIGQQKTSLGLEGVSGVKRYGHYTDGKKDTLLRLNLVYNNGSLAIGTNTERIFTAGQCIGGTLYADIDPITGKAREYIATSNNGTACKGPNGIIGGGDDCCPSGQICGENGCIFDNSNITQCSSYLTEQNCTDDPYNAWKDDPLNDYDLKPVGECFSENSNGEYIRCECFWNATTTSNKCGFRKLSENLTSGNEYSCDYIYSTGACINGIMDISVTTLYSGSEENRINCEDGIPRSVLCGRRSIELPFFDYRNMIISMVLISLLYLLMFRKEIMGKFLN